MVSSSAKIVASSWASICLQTELGCLRCFGFFGGFPHNLLLLCRLGCLHDLVFPCRLGFLQEFFICADLGFLMIWCFHADK